MSNNTLKKSLAVAMGASFAAAMAVAPVASADSNPFGMSNLPGGYMQVAEAEGKCGAKDKAAEGEGKCGEGKMKKDGKCGEGKCGEGKMKKDGKCGEGKCGEGKMKHEAKCGGSKSAE
jgi:uncharacterized low-complexity protein